MSLDFAYFRDFIVLQFAQYHVRVINVKQTTRGHPILVAAMRALNRTHRTFIRVILRRKQRERNNLSH